MIWMSRWSSGSEGRCMGWCPVVDPGISFTTWDIRPICARITSMKMTLVLKKCPPVLVFPIFPVRAGRGQSAAGEGSWDLLRC